MGLLPDTQNCRLCMRQECRERFLHHQLQRKPLVSDSVRHVEIAKLWCRGKSSRHSRRMRNSQFYVSGKRPMVRYGVTMVQRVHEVKPFHIKSSYRHQRILPGWLALIMMVHFVKAIHSRSIFIPRELSQYVSPMWIACQHDMKLSLHNAHWDTQLRVTITILAG